ncbi:MAG: M3 family oligoendopeptidase [Phycisphaeraceae bacterium]|nr:M3 family oligoendopeptidase [Phycisphaeraceae bacterium]
MPHNLPPFDPSDFSTLEPRFNELLQRDIPDADDARQWLTDLSNLSARVQEYGDRRYIDYACHTDDPALEQAYMHFVENVQPKLAPMYSRLQKMLLTTPGAAALEAREPKFTVLFRQWRTDVEIFRDANVPLFTELARQSKDYDKLIGEMQVEYEGKTYTLQQLAKFLEYPSRAVRETTWRLSNQRRLRDRATIDAIFDRMLDLRANVAANADEPNFRGYAWKSMGRFDYTPAQCDQFADAVQKLVLPVVEQLDQRRRAALGVNSLRPWDLGVDQRHRSALSPFETSQQLLDSTRQVFDRIAPALGETFGHLTFGRNLDLDSRKGKRAGGFQSSLYESGEPFIFMNAAGLQRDVDTLLHEAGHAFHFIWARAVEPLIFFQQAPLEFCEVASMSMELIGADFMDVFYEDQESRARAAHQQFESVVRTLPWIATIDQFQHQLYTNRPADAARRSELWLSTLDRFSSKVVDWTSLEAERAAMWQKQLHLFNWPFYYIEYGIAQLGALELWLAYRREPQQALQRYRAALSLGNTRPLPQLFAAAGLSFDFSAERIAPLMDAVAQELEHLEAAV